MKNCQKARKTIPSICDMICHCVLCGDTIGRRFVFYFMFQLLKWNWYKLIVFAN